MNIFETLKKYNNMNGGSLENTSLRRNILVSCENYDISKDQRLLIPFEETCSGLKGFINKNGEVVVKPKYHRICNDCYSESDLIKVAILKPITISYGDGYRLDGYYGIIDSSGREIIPTEYRSEIEISTDKSIFTLRKHDYSYSVVNIKGEEIIPSKKYAWIDGFDNGLARFNTIINDKKKWGIINDLGEEVVPPIYDKIWNFYKKNRTTTTCIEDGCRKEFSLTDLSFIDNKKHISKNNFREHDNDDDYGTHYGEFAGSYAQDVMGYSDDVINDAFEGDPDNYWNID